MLATLYIITLVPRYGAHLRTIDDIKKLRLEVDNAWRRLKARVEQLLQYDIGISQVLSFMSAVDEKADMERTSRGAAAYKVIEDIQDYSQLDGLKKNIHENSSL